MLKVNTRAELEVLKGGKLKVVEPEPAVPAPPAPQQPDLAQEAMIAAAASMQQVAALLAAQAAAAPKKMEAIVHRDANGKMARVEITVV